MTRLLAVIRRDLLKFGRNPVVIAMSLVMPIIYLVILGNSFQGKLKKLPVAVVDQDGGSHSTDFINRLRAIEGGPETFRLVFLKDQAGAIEGVRDGLFKAALIIPPDFTRKYVSKRRAEVGLFIDNTDSISSATVREMTRGAFNSLPDEYVDIDEDPAQRYLRAMDLYRKVDYDQSLVPGVVIMAIFLGTMTTGAFNLVMDRFLGIDESYLLTPLKKSDIVAGLIISGVVITTAITLLVFLLSVAITRMPLSGGAGKCLLIFSIIVLTTLGLISMMFLFLGRVNHPRIVGLLSGFMNVIFFFPSGAVYPVESFPGWLRAFARVNPEAYAVRALKSVLFKDAGIGAIYGDLLFLGAFTVVMMTAGILSFKRTL
jgi:ABC-2 type transport system permease protein